MGKYSLGLFPTCQPLQGVATQFFDFDYDNYKSASGFGPENQGLKMHKPEIVKANKYEEDCTFTYALRDENGTPVKATANIIETEPDSSVKKSAVTKTPKAVGWFEDEDGVRSCELEDGWFLQANNAYYIPTEAGGQGIWEYRDDLPEPQDLKDKCPQYSSLTKRAVAGSREGPPPNPFSSDGYAANLILDDRLEVEEPGYIVIKSPGKPEPQPSAQQCLAKLKDRSRERSMTIRSRTLYCNCQSTCA